MEKFIENLVRDAGKILRDKFGRVKNITYKADRLDVLTEADILADKLITGRIKKKFPAHAIVSEESGKHNTSSKKWIIDPLDGTSNFSLGLPLFVTQLAYVENDEVICSSIYDPIHVRFYFAEKGKGSFLNHKRIKVSTETNFSFSKGCVDLPLTSENLDIFKKIHRAIKHDRYWLRNLGASGVNGSLVASGGMDWSVEMGGFVYDYAPLVLLIREAGGLVKNFKGKDWELTDTKLIGGNPLLVKKLVQIISNK